MTQNYTVDELREMAKRGETFRPGHTRGDIATAYADTLSKPADSGRVGDDERQWRELLAIRVAGPMLYTDDGELSDTTTEPCIDFLRDSADTIACKLADRARATLAAQGQGDRLPAELDAWLQERGLVPDLGEDGSFDMSDLIVALNDHENALMASRPAPPASPAVVPDGLLEHLREALRRVENGHSPRRIPANPGDVDLALSEAIAWLEGRPAPFWVKPAAAPSTPEGDGGEG